MRSCESLGEPCRYCGSHEIILMPMHYAGKCAHCSWEAFEGRPRAERLGDGARRKGRSLSFVALRPSGRAALFSRRKRPHTADPRELSGLRA
jgi:hypothetical protein